MKSMKVFFVVAMILCTIMSNNLTVSAANILDVEPTVRYSIEIEDDAALYNATLISTNSYTENGRYITETVYKQPDGTIITDVLDVSAIAPFSNEGKDTAKRTRTIDGWGSITIEAAFMWYTEGIISYVKCAGMKAYNTLEANVGINTWEKSYTEDYVSVGNAKAQVEYFFYSTIYKFQHQEGTFKITCTDTGVINNN